MNLLDYETREGDDIDGRMIYEDRVITFIPDLLFDNHKVYRITIEDSVSDLAGNQIENTFFSWFITNPMFTMENDRLQSSVRMGAFGAVGDIDNDGDVDIVISNADLQENRGTREGPVEVFINDGLGFFSDETDAWLGDNTIVAATRGMVLVDVNLDNYLDVILATESLHSPPWTDYKDLLLINQGGEGFVDETAERLPYGPVYSHGLCVGDVNSDGAPDIFFNDAHRLLINDGDGFFGSRRYLIPPSNIPSLDCKFADFDLDGDSDLIISTNLGYRYNRLFLNDGTGRFTIAPIDTIPQKINGDDYEALAMEIVDLNVDGYPDVVIANFFDPYTGAEWEPRVNQLLINNGDGTFRDDTERGFIQSDDGGIQFDVSSGDLNGDGFTDLAFAYSFPKGGAKIYLGNGEGVLTEISNAFSDDIPAEHFSNQVLVFDMDNDGDTDLIFLGSYFEHYVYINTLNDP